MSKTIRLAATVLGLWLSVVTSLVPAAAQGLRVSATVIPIRLDGIVLVREGHGIVAKAGLLVVQHGGKQISVPVGGDGRFELPFLPPGTYRADVLGGANVECSIRIRIPEISSMVTQLGTFVCG